MAERGRGGAREASGPRRASPTRPRRGRPRRTPPSPRCCASPSP